MDAVKETKGSTPQKRSADEILSALSALVADSTASKELLASVKCVLPTSRGDEAFLLFRDALDVAQVELFAGLCEPHDADRTPRAVMFRPESPAEVPSLVRRLGELVASCKPEHPREHGNKLAMTRELPAMH